MATTVRSRAKKLLAGNRSRTRYLEVLAVAAVTVAITVAVVLMQRGVAMERTKVVLDCHAAPGVAHTHNADCYDDEGNLVCPLPEVEAHTHDDSCYTEERTLICGLEESEGHQHTDACYDADGNLACGLEESEGHHHTDACYEVTRKLTCGLEEVTEEHVHGPGCFMTVQVNDEDPTEADEGEEQTTAQGGEPSDGADPDSQDAKMPEQSFEHKIKQAQEDSTERVILTVRAEAPEGALPADSAMQVSWVKQEDMTSRQAEAVEKAVADKTVGKILDLQAVDITFVDAEGNAVEPAKPITVTFDSELLASDDKPVVVHVDDLTEDELEVQAQAQEQVAEQGITEVEEGSDLDLALDPKRSAQAIDELSEAELAERDLSLSEQEVAFESDQFSTYVLARTSLSQSLVASDRQTYTITVDAPAEAGIPADAALRVSEILQGTDEYESYQRNALVGMGVEDARNVALARFFDIKIVAADGREIQPAEPVQVTINLAGTPVEDHDAGVVHFDDATGEPESVVAAEDAGSTIFDAASFSVYGVVYTVDFHWEANGKTYQLQMPGGGFLSLESLVEVLGIADGGAQGGTASADTDNALAADAEAEQEAETLTLADVQVSDATREFVSEVESVSFSSPELVWVGKVDTETTVGHLKEANSLEVQYSAELSDEQIAKINAQVVEAGDWALISRLPFSSEEALTVTMKNGDQFVVRVTDAQDPSVFLGKEVIIYDNTEKQAMTSDYATDHRTHFNTIEEAIADNDSSAHWKIEQTNGGYYLKSNEGKYLYLDHTNVRLVDNASQATVLAIQAGNNPDYRINAANNNNNALRYCENNGYPGFFSAVDGTNGAGNYREWLYIREAAKAVEPVGDWLLYFDDDFSNKEITIHVGETITLRPYNKWEWKEGNVDVQTAHWNVGGSAWSDWGISSSDGNGAKLTKTTDGPFEFTRYVKYDDQLITHYWSVQGRATQTGDYTLTNTKNGNTITVHVVDGDPVNQPSTINKIANIKVNLFDYDKNYLLDPSDNSNLANNNNNKNDSTNKMGGSDHFYFLSSGSGDNSNEPWNSYTHANANPDIVKSTLDSEGYPVLNHGKNTSLKYLFDTSKTSWNGGNNDGMIAYPGVVGMFQKDPTTGYYYYNSNTNYYYYDTATGTSKLYQHTYTQTSGASKGSLVNDKPIGFFPFHDYDATDNLYVNQNSNLNHHVGMSMELEFMLPADRKDDNGEDIVFNFSGDDDLWVFVEWVDDQGQKHSKRMLDLGGIHQPITGSINFTDDLSIEAHKPYTLKVFYLERGGCDSNCSIRFNLPIIQDLTVAKKLTGLTEAEKAKYKNEEFTYEILVNGQPYSGPTGPEKIVIKNAAGQDITPQNYRITNGRVTLKDGETITISYLDRSDKFSVAEVNTPNMENFEVPNAERYYHLPADASLYEEEIALTESQMVAEPHTADWVTPTYELEDTEKVTFTNTLKEKNLEVEKKWIGEKNHPDSITFTVSATVDDGNGGRIPYAVAALKESNGTTDKVFTLNDSNKWRYEIEHLPVNTPDGKFIFYEINEGHVEGYTLTGLKDITAEAYNYCNVDVVKLWPDSNGEHTEVITVALKNSANKYYAGVDADGKAVFVDDIARAETHQLKSENNYTHRFPRVPAGTYTAVQLNGDEYTKGLSTYIRNIIQYELENSPVGGPVDPEEETNTPEIHKRIDALRDGVANPDSPHTGENLTDLYRLYLDYKVKSLQDANGVDLLFVIDHSGSMNNSAWQGNPYRAPAVEAALNGENGLISEFLNMNDKNQWAAVGFKGPDGAANYYWSLLNPWYPATEASAYNAGQNGSEVLSAGGTSYVFTRNDASPSKNVTLANEGPNILTNYTAGLWRAEQFLLKQGVKEDGRKKVVVFISDGIPTLHIDCSNGTLQGAGTADGSPYYRDAYGGCPEQTLTEFGYFKNDMTSNGYTFGENLEFYTIGFGGTMQTETGSQLLNGMLDIAYGAENHPGHFMTISDATGSDYTAVTNKLKSDLRTIMGMNESFTNIVIQDDLSTYVDLYGLAGAGASAAEIMNAAKAKVTMTVPGQNAASGTQTVTLYENGAAVDSDAAKFTRADGTTKATIIQKLEYDSSTKTVKAIFDPEYKALEGAVYTLSFDVKATETAYTTYAANGYDKYTEGDKQGQVIAGDADTDFLGTDPDNATSVDKEGFRSNDEAKVTYKHNSTDEGLEYPHPVIQVSAKVDIVKTDQTGAALEGAKFNLYGASYDASKTIEENAGCLIEENLQSKKPTNPVGEDAVIRSGKLSVGTYYLVETKAPDGYNSLPGPVKITVSEENGVLNMSAEIAGEYVGSDKLVKVSNGVWKLSLQNSAGYELPNAGGPGTTMLYLMGCALIGLAGAWILSTRVRRTAA